MRDQFKSDKGKGIDAEVIELYAPVEMGFLGAARAAHETDDISLFQ